MALSIETWLVNIPESCIDLRIETWRVDTCESCINRCLRRWPHTGRLSMSHNRCVTHIKYALVLSKHPQFWQLSLEERPLTAYSRHGSRPQLIRVQVSFKILAGFNFRDFNDSGVRPTACLVWAFHSFLPAKGGPQSIKLKRFSC